MTARLEVRGVGFRHGERRVLEGVSFQASAGEFVALVGLNGAGKSTLLDAIAGLRRPTEGEVWVEGRPVGRWEPRELARRVSHLPQGLRAELPFSAEQVVAMGRYPHADRHFEGDEDRRQVEAAMRRTGCWEYAVRAFDTLSGGERQRVLLAACLAQDAETLLLDEPSTFLDIGAQLECFALLRDEAARGRLCLAVTHDLNLALAHCTRLLVLHQAEIVRDIAVTTLGLDTSADASWLGIFSSRLRLEQIDVGVARVWYT